MKRKLMVGVLVATFALFALPAQAHHANTCNWSQSYSSIQSIVTWTGDCHCRINDGYKAAAQNATDGFGFLDSFGFKSVKLFSFGATDTGSWNTEMDERLHRRVSPNYSIIQKVEFVMSGVSSAGNEVLTVYCTRQSPGSYTYIT